MSEQQQENFPPLSTNVAQYQRQNTGAHCTVGTMTVPVLLPVPDAGP